MEACARFYSAGAPVRGAPAQHNTSARSSLLLSKNTPTHSSSTLSPLLCRLVASDPAPGKAPSATLRCSAHQKQPRCAARRRRTSPHVAEARLPPLTPPSSPLVRRRHVHNARLDQTQPRGRAPSCSRGSMVIIMHVPCGLPATPPLIRSNHSVRPDPRCSSPSPKASGSVVHLQLTRPRV